ncbi:hypothetical protein N5923_23260 [Erwiniaceae bacterium BAC15a-03b]|uniref:Uncharacterized protein n=1 Tax=Winslowiella arboricola TaxID=2978220 RepID=A0A9J6PUS6_9GAMM|nr:hypothetical protein [Winslowiella arboricola]MCU5775132.1 hypothetical protein [Winslowiella arboricola]MCU5780414.1 hypothetical protein [Winslowiella arboricola]
MKKAKLIVAVILYVSAMPALHAADADLPIKCDHGVLAEIYAAKASKFKLNGSTSSYQKARDAAKEHGAELGYPDYGVDSMIEAGVEDVKIKDSITQRLASLDTSGMVISPLVQDCLKKPENYIRNYNP